ncbi:transcription factor BIM2-like isoform X2 [Mercurialis annua]|uniref:transcription factor BIM2-like isoform X2 n=1 Tax=Mercurialis annua TaxID=3986 RepID=UPI00215F9597|nr:transcription factor BIM2-like isoform X2 [Mercurialis annua]
MVKSGNNKPHNLQEEEYDEADDYDSSSYRGKGEGKRSEQHKSNNSNANSRSKHSETEQRRRSKINERFQILREIIPQNDQKRDKASFLLEVIEYIQFLQEKLQMYEGSYQGWGQEPTKLRPWKNHHSPVEDLVDHSQVLKNGSAHETTAMLTDILNPIESDMGTAAVPFNLQSHSNMFATDVRGGVTTQPVQESVSVSDADNMAYQLRSHMWQCRPCPNECVAPSNMNRQQEPTSESGSDRNSRTYSQGILDNLTQTLRSSGVDLSQTSISVQIDVGKQLNTVSALTASSSKDQENRYLNSQLMEQTVFESCMEDSDQAHKRLRTQKI